MALGAFASDGPAAKPPRLAGCGVFPASHASAGALSGSTEAAWNQDVSHAPLDSRSKKYLSAIRRLGDNQAIHPDFGGNGRYGIPYTVVGPHQRRVKVKVSPYGSESDFGRAPIPPHARVEGGSDRHVLVLQRQRCKLYEMFASRYLGGHGHKWHAGSTAKWNLRSTKLRHVGWTSADAAGLPILPGLVRPGEVRRGSVRHAIRVTFEETSAAYVKPASHIASSSCNRNLPPMGLRLRLKRSYYVKHLHRFPKHSQSRPIFRALYHYGMINADNGSNWYITGSSSKYWNDGDLNRLKQVPGRAFVVVKSASRPKFSSDC